MSTAIAAGNTVIILKGCRGRDVAKGRAIVSSVTALGADYSHAVKVVLTHSDGRTIAWFARHPNRLADDTVNLNTGNPGHKIVVRRAA